MSRRSKIAMLVMAAFVAFVEGPLNPYWIWNAIPIGVSYLVLRATFENRNLHVPGVVFAVISCILVVLLHIAWMFDLFGMAGSSSTAPLMFVAAPAYVLVLAAAGWVFAWGVGWLKRSDNEESDT